jgi:hypothetical protein
LVNVVWMITKYKTEYCLLNPRGKQIIHRSNLLTFSLADLFSFFGR